MALDSPLRQLLRHRHELGVRAASCLDDYIEAGGVSDDGPADELAAGLLQALFGDDDRQTLVKPVVFETHRTLAMSARVERIVPLLAALYPRATHWVHTLPTMAEVDDRAFQLAERALLEFAPRHPARANRSDNSFLLEDLGRVWLDDAGAAGVSVNAESNEPKRTTATVTGVSRVGSVLRWDCDARDANSIREAVGAAVAYLLRAAPPDVRNR